MAWCIWWYSVTSKVFKIIVETIILGQKQSLTFLDMMFHGGLFSSPASIVSSSESLRHTFMSRHFRCFSFNIKVYLLCCTLAALSCCAVTLFLSTIDWELLLEPSQERRFKPRDTTGLQWTGCVKEAFVSRLAAGKVNFAVESLFINRNFKKLVHLNQHRFCQPPC